MELPIVYYDITLENDGTGLVRTSVVDEPAIEKNYKLFNQDKKEVFKVFNQDKQLIAGPIMIPDMKILRVDNNNNYYYCIFSKGAVERTVKKAQRDGTISKMNLQHIQDSKSFINSSVLFQSYIIDENTRTEIHEDYPDGTWYGVFWIEDTEEWNKIKNGTYKGFSVEINVLEIPEENITDDYFNKENFENIIFKIINDDSLDDELKMKILKEITKN